PLIGLTLATFLSRLSLFLGVKTIGGLQTALLGLAELLVTIVLSSLWLHEQLTPLQWTGAAILAFSLLLVRFEPGDGKHISRGWLAWIRPPEMPRDIWPPYQ
ncbi:MAG TPA: EamA family transporter, partial [Anaerolineales bacterium]